MKRVGFFCKLPRKTLAEIGRRKKAMRLDGGEVVRQAIEASKTQTWTMEGSITTGSGTTLYTGVKPHWDASVLKPAEKSCEKKVAAANESIRFLRKL